MADTTQRELTGAGPLLDRQGHLNQAGWARQPVLDCNLENARFYPIGLRALQRLRVKRWDYYGITTPAHFFSFTLADLGYAGMVFAYTLDFATGALHEQTLMLPLSRAVHLPRSSIAGASTFDNGHVKLSFQAEPETRRLSVRWPEFAHWDLSADLTLHLPSEHESMAIVVPIKGNRFYYNRKINCMPAEGWVAQGIDRFEVTPDTSLGNLDWGRGVWEYKSFWVWASASGFLGDGRSAGLNLGYGFGDTSAATENALILDARVHKLGQVDFTYTPGQFMDSWNMRSPDGRLALAFVPFKERVAKSNLLLVRSEVHQIFGRYTGLVRADDGEEIRLEGLIGWAEEHQARW